MPCSPLFYLKHYFSWSMRRNAPFKIKENPAPIFMGKNARLHLFFLNIILNTVNQVINFSLPNKHFLRGWGGEDYLNMYHLINSDTTVHAIFIYNHSKWWLINTTMILQWTYCILLVTFWCFRVLLFYNCRRRGGFFKVLWWIWFIHICRIISIRIN